MARLLETSKETEEAEFGSRTVPLRGEANEPSIVCANET